MASPGDTAKGRGLPQDRKMANRAPTFSIQRIIFLAVSLVLCVQVGWWINVQIRESGRLLQARSETLRASLAEAWQMDSLHMLALLAASLGVALVLSQGRLGFGFGGGEMAALAAAVFAAASANAISAVRHTDNAATIFFFFCIVGLPVVIPFALSPWPGGVGPWGLAILMSLLAYGGQILMSDAYGALSVPEAAIWLQLLPIVQYLLAVPLLKERATLSGLAGVLVTVAGVVYGTVWGHRRAKSLSRA